MKRGYLLAAVVFAVLLTVVLVGCPKKSGPPPMPLTNSLKLPPAPPGGAPAVNTEAENAEPAAAEVSNMEAPPADATIPAPAPAKAPKAPKGPK